MHRTGKTPSHRLLYWLTHCPWPSPQPLQERLVRGQDTIDRPSPQSRSVSVGSVIARVHAVCFMLVRRVPGCLPSRHMRHLRQALRAMVSGFWSLLSLWGSGWVTLWEQNRAAGPEVNSRAQGKCKTGGNVARKMKFNTEGIGNFPLLLSLSISRNNLLLWIISTQIWNPPFGCFGIPDAWVGF